MKNVIFLLLFFNSLSAYSQLNDEFTDGDFLSNPNWTGSNSGTDFSVVNNRLRSGSNIASSSFYLSTGNTLAMNTQWDFWVNLQFNPSGSNYVDVYLISDKADLKNPAINGYFIRIGGTDDEICLYKRSGSASTSIKLIDGINGILNSSNNTLKIKVFRNDSGLFTLQREAGTVGSGFYTEGTATDNNFTTSGYFGILIQQSTSSFFQKHFFDDFNIGPLVTDTIQPGLTGITILNEETLEISFNEPMDSLSVKNPANFSLSSYEGNISTVLSRPDPARYRLELSEPLKTGNYTLKTANVKDRAGNQIGIKDTIGFRYVKPYLPIPGDIIINEIFADPNPQIDLPSVEFVELYNTSKENISLKSWKFSDLTSNSVLGEVTMAPESYLILCAKSDTAEFKQFGKVLGISPWPSLNNAGDQLTLKNAQNFTMDSLSYSDRWYRDTYKRQGGWTLERADPKSICAGAFNWYSSKDSTGGTPGKINSVFISGYDLMELKADSLTRTSDSTLVIHFNKHLNEPSIKNDRFRLIPDDSQVKEISKDSEFRNTSLLFNKKFLPGKSYQLEISGIKDCSGQIINHSDTLTFRTPQLPAPAPERVDTAKIYITEIFADPSPEIGLPLSEFVEIYNPGNDTVNLDGWLFSDMQTKATLKNTLLSPKQYLILCPVYDTLQYKGFGKVLGLNPWPSLNNTTDQLVLRSFKSRVTDSISYSADWYGNDIKKQGGWTLERIDHQSKCSGIFNWTASTNSTGGTPGNTNSVYILNYDSIPFHADSINRTSDSTLTVFFNKPPDSSAIKTNHFNMDSIDGLTIKSAVIISPMQVSLGFNQKFRSGSAYHLNIRELNDCSGNIIADDPNLSFIMPKIPQPAAERIDTAKLYITEIFADPSPEINLPLAEFIEIFNPGTDTIDLEGWSLNDTQTKSILKKARIRPGQYLILCPAADTTHYKTYGNTLGLNLWPSLNNSMDQVVLKSFKNRTTDSIAYHISWYGNELKKSGGWALERIDYQSGCGGIFNWTASTDKSGGTPGKVNSVYVSNYDQMKFQTDSLIKTSDSTLMVYFNKVPDTAGLTSDKFILSPETGSNLRILHTSDPKKLLLTFSEKFKSGKEYLLNISNLTDCSGNLIQIPEPLKFSIPEIPKPIPEPPRTDTARVMITEILADPSPEIALPLVEFIELYNPGTDTADLSGWSVSDQQSKAVLKKFKLAPKQYLILCPEADTANYKSMGLTMGINPWPSLNNTSDQISLKSFTGRKIDSVSYSLSWYKDPIKKTGGWALEKTDFSMNACQGFYNWTASVDPKGGTPGRANSTIRKMETLKTESLKLISDSSLSISFSTIPDTNSLKPANFILNNQTGKPSKLIIDPGYRTVRLVFKEKFKEGIQYVLKIDSLFSCSGIHITGQDAQIAFEIPVIAEKDYPVIINEIMADPTPVRGLPEAEYVELFNPTDKPVELAGLEFGNSYIFSSGELKPGGFLILCAAVDSSKFKEYGPVKGIQAWQSIKNMGDILTLKNNKGREIQRIEFQQSWYRNSEKQKGGYSLELIYSNPICPDSQNWAASQDSLGGSPGRANSRSLANDVTGSLKLAEIELSDSLSLLISFNKSIDSLKASDSDNYSLNNGIGKASIALPLGPDFNKVRVQFGSKLSPGMTYNLTVENVCDCGNNPLSPEFNRMEFFYPVKLKKNDVLLSEILFNPKPEGSDFVEIYNNTLHPVDLKEVYLGKSADNNPGPLFQISKKQLLMEPGSYLALSPDPENIRKEYFMKNPDKILKMQTFPSFNNDSGTAVLISNNIQIDILSYNEKMHFPLLRNVEGISLERRNLNKPANEAGNLRSATSASGGASPGYQNSQYTEQLKQTESFELVSRTFSPDNDGFEDFIEMNYQFNESGKIANVSVFNDKGQLVKRILKNYILNANGSFQWDGFNENSQLAQGGIYILHAEIFTPEGETKIFRKSFALVTRPR